MEIIATDKAPAALGPYSQAVKAGANLFVSGQLGIDPATGKMVSDQTTDQARQVFKNLRAVLAEAGLSLNDIAKTTVFVADMNEFPTINQIYAEEMGDHKPARATVEVSRLPLDGRIEIECIALLK